MGDHMITSVKAFDDLVTSEWKRPHCYLRGQPADYELVPSLGRRYRGESFFVVEALLLEQFKKHYAAGFPQGGGSPEFLLEPRALNEWQWTAIAQHHGLPTRLLDWSLDQRVALFFAVANRNKLERTSDGVVYLFHDNTLIVPGSGIPVATRPEDPFTIDNVRPYLPQSDGLVLPRIKAQKGALTFQPNPVEDLIEQLNPEVGHRSLRCVVPRALKSAIRGELQGMGMDESTLFPGLDGICRHVEFEVLGD